MATYSRTTILLCLVAFLTVGTAAAQYRLAADATFSGPVQLAGVLLPAGRYHFAQGNDRRTVVVTDAGDRIVAISAVTPISRPKGGPIVTLRPQVGQAAPDVFALYFGGGTTGVEFPRGVPK